MEIVSIVRDFTREHEEENNSDRKNVAFGVVLDILSSLGIDDLWRNEAWSPTPFEEILVHVLIGGESEIDQFEDVVPHEDSLLLEYDVIRLEISVHDSLLVQSYQGLEHALENEESRLVVKLALVEVEDLSPLQEFHHQVQRILALVDLDELNHVRVVDGLHDSDFVNQRLLSVGLGLEVLLREGLDREFLLVRVSLNQVDLGVKIKYEGLTLAKEPFPIILMTLNLLWKSV